MWKNIIQRGRPQITLRRMRIARWIPKATNTHSEYVMFLFHYNNGYINAPQCYMYSVCQGATYVHHISEPHSYNHWYSGKAIIITYSECVSLALIVHAMRMRSTVDCGPPRSTALRTKQSTASSTAACCLHLSRKNSSQRGTFQRPVNSLCHWRFKFPPPPKKSFDVPSLPPRPNQRRDALQTLSSGYRPQFIKATSKSAILAAYWRWRQTTLDRAMVNRNLKPGQTVILVFKESKIRLL